MSRQAVILGLLILVAPTVLEAQFSYSVNDDQTVTITGYAGPGGNVAIPSTINGMPVSAIGQQAFLLSSLAGVVIPVGVTSIGVEAFGSCEALTNATLPDGLITIGQGAFNNCNALVEITIPSGVTYIGLGRSRRARVCRRLLWIHSILFLAQRTGSCSIKGRRHSFNSLKVRLGTIRFRTG